jgi:cobalt-zinc-cadmium efflux system membrane fusion protein
MKNLIIYTAVFLAIIACNNSKVEEKTDEGALQSNIITLTADQVKNAGIETGKMGSNPLSTVIKVNGVIDVPPQSLVSVSAPLGGYLKTTKLLPGTPVSNGDVIATMEDQQYIQLQQDYLTTKAQFSFTEGEYVRQKELNQSKAISDKIFEQTKANYISQNVLLRSLEEKLKLIGISPEKLTPQNISSTITLRSSINGYVSAVKVNVGKYVSPSVVMFELINPDDIHLAVTVFEKDINKLQVGQRLLAYTNDQPEKKYSCTVILISKNLSAERSAEVHCHFEKFDKSLLPGMYMNAEIESLNTQAKTLPEEAVVRFENKQYAFIVKGNNQFVMQEIKTGINLNGLIEIFGEGTDTAQTFVTKGAYSLLMKVKNTSDE